MTILFNTNESFVHRLQLPSSKLCFCFLNEQLINWFVLLKNLLSCRRFSVCVLLLLCCRCFFLGGGGRGRGVHTVEFVPISRQVAFSSRGDFLGYQLIIIPEFPYLVKLSCLLWQISE